MAYFGASYFPSGHFAPSYFASFASLFPTQYAGLRFFHDTVQSLCLVLPADAPTGDTPMIRKGGTTYAVYLVDTTDPNASTIRLNTNDGIKAIRLLT